MNRTRSPLFRHWVIGSLIRHSSFGFSHFLVLTVGLSASDVQPPNYGFLKGNTHVHTNGSGDSDTPVALAVKWYEERGYDFIIVTDHNRVTVHPHTQKMLVFPGVEMTKNEIASEDSGKSEYFCVHMNGYFLTRAKQGFISDPPVKQHTRLAMYASEFVAIKELGGFACLNHPNFLYTGDAQILTRLAAQGLRFFEVYNSADKSKNDGEPGKPSTEQLWDTVLSTGKILYGIAADDTHHYYDAPKVLNPRIGNLAWIMVRAGEKKEASIKAAILSGDFYGSTGVTLKKLEISDKAMDIEVVGLPGRNYTIRFIGRDGKLLAEAATASSHYEFKGNEMYVRAVVVDSEKKKAWIQPTFLGKRADSEGKK